MAQCLEMIFRLSQEGLIDAQPEIAFDALRVHLCGLLADVESASVKRTRFLFIKSFLAEKEERAPPSPQSFILSCAHGFLQEPNACAHVLQIFALIIKSVCAAYQLFN